MKQLAIGDILIISEDGDSWDDLIKVVKKANKAYLEYIKEMNSRKKKGSMKELVEGTLRKIFF
jgi:uncharacterized protein YqgV (UPF0045/DUF77 family)